jgi:hypothetical protein
MYHAYVPLQLPSLSFHLLRDSSCFSCQIWSSKFDRISKLQFYPVIHLLISKVSEQDCTSSSPYSLSYHHISYLHSPLPFYLIKLCLPYHHKSFRWIKLQVSLLHLTWLSISLNLSQDENVRFQIPPTFDLVLNQERRAQGGDKVSLTHKSLTVEGTLGDWPVLTYEPLSERWWCRMDWGADRSDTTLGAEMSDEGVFGVRLKSRNFVWEVWRGTRYSKESSWRQEGKEMKSYNGSEGKGIQDENKSLVIRSSIRRSQRDS